MLEQAAIKVLPVTIARGELGHHYRKGWAPGNQSGRPRFDQPVQNLPAEPVPGNLTPLRSGRNPYARPAATERHDERRAEAARRPGRRCT